MKDEFFMQEQWGKIGVRHHHGVLLPLSSIHTSSSAGIGEILDLIPLIDWLSQTGFSTLQLLPLNDTGSDPSPYMSLSAYALHPIYLSLESLPNIRETKGYHDNKHIFDSYRAKKRVQYHDVLKKKLEIAKAYIFDGQGKSIQTLPEFSLFVEQEKEWLLPYALFRALKERNNSKAWWHFSEYAKRPSSYTEAIQKDPHLEKETQFWIALQYLLFTQWQHVRAHAASHNILLMGDLPILVNKDSSDVWWNPELFSLDLSVGAPPDMYSKEGQSWGFPVYRWDRMRQEGYSWFKNRLKVQEKLYDIFRIDHIVGLFRLWSIPPGKKAIDGSFLPKEPHEWVALGEEILHIIHDATTMLPIGEDLGDIPDCVHESMRKFGIPGTRVLRWEKNWKEALATGKRAIFRDPRRFSPESLVTVSTHDSSTMEGWWNEDVSDVYNFTHDLSLPWQHTLTSELRYHILKLCHSARSLFHINLIQEYLAFFSELSWNDPSFDRINTPGTISDNNWTWKMKPSLEELRNHSSLKEIMKKLSS